MASPSVTYNFVNGTVADGDAVDTNFQDLINAMTDGTKSFSIDALTVAGAALFNGPVTLGNATGDDVVVTGYIASALIPKTDATYALGGLSNAFSALYIEGLSNLDGAVVINESSADVDFRVESNGNSHALFVDASADFVGICSSSPAAVLHVFGTAAAAPNTGSTSSALLRLTTSSKVALDHGCNTNYVWMQASDTDGLGTHFPIVINPNGGNVGIGTSSPSKKLDVYVGTTADIETYVRNNTINILTKVSGTTEAQFGTETNHQLTFIQNNASAGYINTSRNWYQQNNSASWSTTSDIRLKDVEKDILYGLAEICAIHPFIYTFKDNIPFAFDTSVRHFGVSAQEIEGIIPEAVVEDDKGFKSVKTDPIFWTLVNAVKELSAKSDAQQALISSQADAISSLTERMNQLESKIAG
jgi:hypothetical protein